VLAIGQLRGRRKGRCDLAAPAHRPNRLRDDALPAGITVVRRGAAAERCGWLRATICLPRGRTGGRL